MKYVSLTSLSYNSVDIKLSIIVEKTKKNYIPLMENSTTIVSKKLGYQ